MSLKGVVHKTVIDNVALPLIIKGEGKKAAREKAALRLYEERIC